MSDSSRRQRATCCCYRSRILWLSLGSLWLSTACAPGPRVSGPGREPTLRVGLVVGAAQVVVAGQGTVEVIGTTSFTLPAGADVRVVPADTRVRLDGYPTEPADEFEFRSLDRSRFLLLNGRPYRGALVVYSRDRSVVAVNEVGVEAYLRSVVTAEMGPRTGNESAALEAQAIVSRTYALKNRGRFRSEGYDIRAGTSDQAYPGVDRETALGVSAVENTAGLVVTYRGDLIAAFFHSTCGYSTASPSEAFGSVRDVAYLRPVSDRRPSGGYYCDISPRFRWSVEWDATELKDILRSTVPAELGVEQDMVDDIRDIHIQQKGRSGRVTELRIAVGRGEIPVFGPDLRRVLQTPERRPLGSTAIEIAVAERVDDRVERLRVSGAGWGHGVGMCQWGAVARARAGQKAATIISTYFPGTHIERWY